MAYSQLPTRTTSDANAAADVNQLQANIEALKGGAGSAAPTTNIEALASIIGQGTVDGVAKKLLWKTLTGTTDAGDDTTTVAHEVTLSKILFVTLIVQNSGTDWYNFSDATQTYVQFDSTNLYIVAIPAGFRNQSYKATIFYFD